MSGVVRTSVQSRPLLPEKLCASCCSPTMVGSRAAATAHPTESTSTRRAACTADGGSASTRRPSVKPTSASAASSIDVPPYQQRQQAGRDVAGVFQLGHRLDDLVLLGLGEH